MEILAPAGAKEQLIAAVRSGANAVYLGTKSFNARRNADNFADDDLKWAISYAHARGVRVYVTLNTVITDNERDEAIATVRDVASAGADAVIIQDMAMYRIVKEVCPDMPLHASTQMSVHNTDGARALEKLGFSRLVPARELSLEELKVIRESTNLELEVFIHGALCMSVSGQCYLSSVLGQRSANRGLCAQPCRLDFKCDGRSHVLSLKDLSAIDMIKELERIGINSAKIEGRMKRPEYVAAATSACKKALNGESYDKEMLRAIFSRSGFTDGYLKAKRTPDMFGYRTRDDVVSAAPILKTIANGYRNELPLIGIDMHAVIKANAPMCLSVNDGKNDVTVEGGIPEAASARPADCYSITRSLIKCGGTQYFANNVTVDIDNGLYVAASAVNEMRKNALTQLDSIREKGVIYTIYDVIPKISKPLPCPERTLVYARFETASQIVDGADRIILDFNELYADREVCKKYKGLLIAEVPSLMFSSGAIREKLSELKNRGIDTVYAPNLYVLELAKSLGLKAIGGFGLNINNSIALDEYKKLGLTEAEVSFECTLDRFDKMSKPIPCGLIVYGKMPLITFRVCPIKGENSCGNCNGHPILTDRMGIDMTVLCKDKKYGRLLNPMPIYMGDKLAQFKNAHFITAYFTDENASECKRVLELIRRGGDYKKKFTRGLYYKDIK